MLGIARNKVETPAFASFSALKNCRPLHSHLNRRLCPPPTPSSAASLYDTMIRGRDFYPTFSSAMEYVHYLHPNDPSLAYLNPATLRTRAMLTGVTPEINSRDSLDSLFMFSPRYRGTDALEAPSVSWPDYDIDHDEPTEVRPTTSRGLKRLGYFDRNSRSVGGSVFFDHDLPPIAQNETLRHKWSTTLLGLATTLVRKLHASRSSRRSRSSTSSIY